MVEEYRHSCYCGRMFRHPDDAIRCADAGHYLPIHNPQIPAIEALKKERLFQDNKWGGIDDHGHTIGEWILLIEAELEEAKRALIKGGVGRDSVLMEVVQVGALALACIEQHGTDEKKERTV